MQSQKTKQVYLCKLAQSKPIKIPNDWEVKKIKNIAKINPEKIGDEYNHKKILYVDIGSIEDFQVSQYDAISLDTRPSRAQRIVKKNDVIVSTVRPYLKGFTKIVDEKPNIICSTGFAVIRAKFSEDNELIFQYVKGKFFETNILRHMDGLAYPAVSSEVIRNTLIPLPKLKVYRKKIGEILYNFDKLIQKQKNIVMNEENFLRNSIQILCVRGIKSAKLVPTQFHPRVIRESIPPHWKTDQLMNVLTENPQNGINVRLENYGKGFPIVEIDALYASEFFINQEKLQKVPLLEEELNNYRLTQDDFLINRVSKVPEGAGKLVLVKNQRKDVVFEGNIIRFRIDDAVILPMFFEYFSWTNFYKRYIQSTCKTTTLTSIDQEIISQIPILIPPIPEQEKIIEILSARKDLVDLQRNILLKLRLIKKGLMQKLLTGQIQVN